MNYLTQGAEAAEERVSCETCGMPRTEVKRLKAALLRVGGYVEALMRTEGYRAERDWLGPFLHGIQRTVEEEEG